MFSVFLLSTMRAESAPQLRTWILFCTDILLINQWLHENRLDKRKHPRPWHQHARLQFQPKKIHETFSLNQFARRYTSRKRAHDYSIWIVSGNVCSFGLCDERKERNENFWLWIMIMICGFIWICVITLKLFFRSTSGVLQVVTVIEALPDVGLTGKFPAANHTWCKLEETGIFACCWKFYSNFHSKVYFSSEFSFKICNFPQKF